MLSDALDVIDLTDENKLFGRSTPDIKDAFDHLVLRLKRDGTIRYKGKASNRASVLNAMVLWLATRPASEQSEVIRLGTELLNRHLETGVLDLSPRADDSQPSAFPHRPAADQGGAADPRTGEPLDLGAKRRRKRPSA